MRRALLALVIAGVGTAASAMGCYVDVANVTPTLIAPSGVVRVENINSDIATTLPNAFRYVEPMLFQEVSPNHGSFLGGTRIIIIRGSGFPESVFVTIGGVPAAVIHVSDSEIVAVTPAIGRRGEP